MEDMSHLYDAAQSAVPMQSTLDTLGQYIVHMDKLDNNIDELETRLSTLKDERRKLAQELIPGVVLASGLSEFKLQDGRKLKVAQKVKPTIKDIDGLALYLTERGEADILKTSMELGRLDPTVVDNIRDQLYQLTGEIPKVNQTVHPMTLTKWVKDTFGRGDAIDVNAIPPCVSAYVYYDTTIKGR